jgi:hypothetical protein
MGDVHQPTAESVGKWNTTHCYNNIYRDSINVVSTEITSKWIFKNGRLPCVVNIHLFDESNVYHIYIIVYFYKFGKYHRRGSP